MRRTEGRGAGWAGAALDLALPLVCGGCGDPGSAWCPGCGRATVWAPRQVSTTAGPVVWAAAAYEGPLRRAIAAFKDGGRRDLAGVLGQGLARSVLAASPGVEPPVLVPAPSSARSRRRRGDMPTALLARRAAAHIGAWHGRAPDVVEALAQRGRVADQGELDLEGRLGNLVGAHRLTRSARHLVGRRVILVDDIVTTGATVTEGLAVLRRCGASSAGVAVLAATPRRQPVRWPAGEQKVDERS